MIAIVGLSATDASLIEGIVSSQPGSRTRKAPVTSTTLETIERDFQAFAEAIERAIESSGESGVIVFVECEEIRSLEPVGTTGDQWSHLVSMLILAFPEVHFVLRTAELRERVFDEGSAASSRPWTMFAAAHVVAEWSRATVTHVVETIEAGYSPLFDPTGLREAIRVRLGISRSVNAVAAAIDEEESYALFGAFVAYRYGYRTYSVSRHKLMKRLFPEEATTGDGSQQESVTLTYEDMFLNFIDRPHKKSRDLAYLQIRDALHPGLCDVERRMILSAGHGEGPSREIWRKNEEYMAAPERDRAGTDRAARFGVVYKPVEGIATLWKKTLLPEKADSQRRTLVARDVAGDSHSAPGRLLLLSNVLLLRSRAMLEELPTVRRAIIAATLALDARRLLGTLTPTVSLQALSLQHEGEVVAESLFLGVERSVIVRSRLAEIKADTKTICKSFKPSRRRRSELNAALAIVEAIAARYRERHQIDGELMCLAESRKLWARFRVSQEWWTYVTRWPLLYWAFVLESQAKFVGTLVTIALGFAGSYGLFAYLAGRPIEGGDVLLASFERTLTGSASAGWELLLPLRAESPWNTFWEGWVIFQTVVSVVHVGLLVNHLHLMSARR